MAQRYRGRRKSAPKQAPLPKDPVEVYISEIGAKGDGLGVDAQGQGYFVPASIDGDRLSVQITARRGDKYHAEILEIITAGEGRIAPPCPFYGDCGGCQLQHVDDASYQGFKKQRIKEALKRHHIDTEVLPPVLTGPGLRRRAAFSVLKKGKKVVFGFNARQSHRIVEIDQCLLLTPRLSSLIEPLRALVLDVLKQEGRGDIIINDPEEVADLVFALLGFPDLKVQEKLLAFAERHKIGRLSWQRDASGEPEILAQRLPVKTHFGQVPIDLPVSPFLQPSKRGEEALVNQALSALSDEKKVLDLFAGCGSFTLPLAEKFVVHAVESNASALKAMERAAGRASLGGRITTEVRDLDRQPLMDKELEPYQAVLFDPPRAGAMEQSKTLAESKVPLIIAVSCNPATLARDLEILIKGGYRLERITPVDQFTWSAHVEAVAVLRR